MDMTRMKRILTIIVAALILAGAACGDAAYGPGLTRAAGEHSYEQAVSLGARYGVDLTDGYPLYTPAHPQPMNAYMITHPLCQVGIDGDGMYWVSEKGVTPELAALLDSWMGGIEAASGGVIRFVADPDDADVLVAAKQSYDFYGQYSGDGMSAAGYSCAVGLTAIPLAGYDDRYGFTETRKPEDTVGLWGDGDFWVDPPELAGSDKLALLAENVMAWYGFGAQRGSKGDGVKAMQQALIDRGFLEGMADGDFGPKTEAALTLFQQSLGLEETGVVDAETLMALYYGSMN